MMPPRLDAEITGIAAVHARRTGGGYVGPEHILLAILSFDDGSNARSALGEVGVTPDAVEKLVSVERDDEEKSSGIVWSPAAQVVLGVARGLALSEGSSRVTGVHALIALVHESSSSPHLLTVLGASPEVVIAALVSLGEDVPSQPTPKSDPHAEMGQRVYFPDSDKANVLRAMLKAFPPGSVNWGWNVTKDGRCWIQAEAGVEIEMLVRQNVGDENEVNLEG